jgi:hypothetical protein
LDKKNKIEVKLQVKNLSFSAHADAKGIMQLIRQSGAKNVMLVHGEKMKMSVLKQRIMRELGIACYDPPNGMTIHVAVTKSVPVDISTRLLIESHPHEKISIETDTTIRLDETHEEQPSSRKRWLCVDDDNFTDKNVSIRGVVIHEPGKVRNIFILSISIFYERNLSLIFPSYILD